MPVHLFASLPALRRVARAAIAAMLMQIVAAAAASSPSRTPNVLLCVADDQSFPHASAYGCRWVQTPAFDRVAREGLLFTRAYTPNAKCAPSRACLLTGRNSWQLESAANHAGFYPAGYPTLFESLGSRGYFTGHTGKPWAPGIPGTTDGKPRELVGPAFNKRQIKPPTAGISSNDYAANFADFLQARPAGKPFCFWFGPNEPHRPYEQGSGEKLGGKNPAHIESVPNYWPDDPIVRGDLLDYAFEIEYFDRQLSRFLALLEEAGELDNTIIVVTADNGLPFPRAKGASYDASHHVPFAIRWGGGIERPGRTVEQLVSFIDLAPTLVELAGIAPADTGMAPFAGRSLIRVLRDAVESPTRDFVLTGQERHDIGRPGDVGYPVRGIICDGFLYLRNFEPARWPMCDPISGYLNTDGSPTKTLILEQNRRGVNHWQWELNFGRRPAEELYDLRIDSQCVANLVTSLAHAERLEALRRRLIAALETEGDPRVFGRGEIFDRYPHANNPGFYDRFTKGEKVRAYWVEESDFEPTGFDPERPLRRP